MSAATRATTSPWFRHLRRGPLLPALAATSFIPIGIHVTMLDVLGVPHPGPIADTDFIAWTDDLFTTIGALLLFRRLDPRVAARAAAYRVLVVSVLVAAMTGRVLRDLVMNVLVCDAPVASLSTLAIAIDQLLPALPLVLILSAASWAAPSAGSATRRVLVSFAISFAVWALVGFVLDPALDPLVTAFDAHEGRTIAGPPYSWGVDLASYATFLEPGIAATILVALIWDRLPASATPRIATATFIVFLLLGPVARPVIDGLRGPDHLAGFLGPLQFSLETLALGALAALTCRLCLRPEQRQVAIAPLAA